MTLVRLGADLRPLMPEKAFARHTAKLAVLLIGATLPGAASAETLADAIQAAYQTNPAIQARRAELRRVDEEFVQAEAAYGPQVNLSVNVSDESAHVPAGATVFGQPTAANYRTGNTSTDLSAVQPLYTSGMARAGLKTARADIMVSRERLRQAEADLVAKVAGAYLDVRRDEASLAVIQDEIRALSEDAKEVTAKGQLGALTKTDVAQARERLLAAQAQVNIVQGRLGISRAEYLNVVGQNPGVLEPEGDLPGLPATSDAAFDMAAAHNPTIFAAIATERAARERVDQAKAQNGATVSLRLDANVSPTEPYLQHQYEKSASVALVYNQPIFTAGLASSKVREAHELDNRAILDVEQSRRDAVQSVAQAWNQLASTQGAIALEQLQLSTEQAAVQGNRIEERVGQRSTIDRLSLLQSRHDEYLAKVALLSAMGVLEAKALAPQVKVYDPKRAFNRVRSRVFDPLRPVISVIEDVAAQGRSTAPLTASGPGDLRPDMALPPLLPPSRDGSSGTPP
jgi:TolC family type I secretion outer membrane protein